MLLPFLLPQKPHQSLHQLPAVMPPIKLIHALPIVGLCYLVYPPGSITDEQKMLCPSKVQSVLPPQGGPAAFSPPMASAKGGTHPAGNREKRNQSALPRGGSRAIAARGLQPLTDRRSLVFSPIQFSFGPLFLRNQVVSVHPVAAEQFDLNIAIVVTLHIHLGGEVHRVVPQLIGFAH